MTRGAAPVSSGMRRSHAKLLRHGRETRDSELLLLDLFSATNGGAQPGLPVPEPRLTEIPTNWLDPLRLTSSSTLPLADASFSCSAAFDGVSTGV